MIIYQRVYSNDLLFSKSLDQFKYNESWDESISVCIKIKELVNTKSSPLGNALKSNIDSALLLYDIMKTYICIVKFIKW